MKINVNEIPFYEEFKEINMVELAKHVFKAGASYYANKIRSELFDAGIFVDLNTSIEWVTNENTNQR